MLNFVSLIIGIVALVCAAIAFVPLLGWANWLIIPLAVIGAGVGQMSGSSTGRNLNLFVILVGIVRLMLGRGIIRTLYHRIDAYIARAPPSAQPILKHVRERVHAIAPEAQETLKWSMPSFTIDGKILMGMAAFKAHATIGFWRGQESGRDASQDTTGQL